MRRRPCRVALQSPCERAQFRRVPVLFRRGAPRGGSSAPPDLNLYGLTNFSAGSYMQSASGGGEAGVATGFGGFLLLQLKSLGAAIQVISENLATGGYTLYLTAANVLTLEIKNASNVSSLCTAQLTASDVGKLLLVTLQHTGAGAIRMLVWRGTTSSGDVAITGYSGPTTALQSYGSRATTFPFTTGVLLSEMFFRGQPTLAQVQAVYDAVRALGDVPTSLGPVFGAVGGFSAANYLQASAGQGIVGTASALTVQALVRNAPGISGYLAATLSQPSGFTGYQFQVADTIVTFSIANAAGAAVTGSAPLPSGSQGNALVAVTATWDGTNHRIYAGGILLVTTPSVGFLPGANGMRVGDRIGPSSAPFGGAVLQVQGGSFVASQADIAASTASALNGFLSTLPGAQHFYDLKQDVAGGSVPATLPDRIGTDTLTRNGAPSVTTVGMVATHRWSLKDELAGTVVVTGQTAPAQLTDRVTLAAGDALARVGSPTVVKIDPAIDGRRTLGAQGFSAANYLTTALSAGLRGATTGFWGEASIRFDVVPSTGQLVAHCTNAATTQGWYVQITGGTLRVVVNSSTAVVSSAYTVVAADVGRVRHLAWQFTSTGLLRMYLDGVQIGADVGTGTAYVVPDSTCATQLGCWTTSPFVSGSLFGLGGGNGNPTLAQIQQAAADFAATGQLQGIAGLTDHRWNLTADILASGVDAVPAVVLDRVGTDNLTRVGPDYAISGKQGLRLLGAATNVLQTAPGGGIQGSASALTVALLWSPVANLAVGGFMASKFGSSLGWDFRRLGTVGTPGTLNCALSTAGGSVAGGTAYTIQAGDLGTLMHVAFTYDGANLRVYVNGTLISTTAITGSATAAAVAMLMGARSDGSPVNNDSAFFAIGGGAYVATAAELLAQATAAIASGRLTTISGRTDDRLYNFDQDAVAQGTSLPSQCVNRAANGIVDPLVRVGSGLTLAQQTARLFSYETKPIYESVNGLTASDFYSIAGGYAGDPAAFGFVWVGTIDSQAVASATRVLVAKGDAGYPGFQLATIATNSAFQFQVGSGASTRATASTSGIAATELGKQFIVGCWYDGSKVHMAVRRIEIGTGTALSGAYAVSTAAFTIGKRSDSLPADGTSFRGFIGMSGAPSLAEFQAIHDAIMAREQIVDPTGRAVVLYDPTKDAVTAGNAVPATITDRIGSAPLAKQGSPTLSLGYARAAA